MTQTPPLTSPASPLDADVEARLDDLLQKLYGLYHVDIDMSLERILRFLHQIGDPHLHLPKVIHVAGTNGKGSTVATLRALLEASGHKVHVYTSPHLVHPTERIRLAGQLISSEALLALLEECLTVNGTQPITFFEIFTAAAFLAFSRHPADYCLLETGMGGRLDTTNVVPDPVCTVITTISYDHQKFLGNTLPAIATEKAGIMKPGVPCVIGRQTEEGMAANLPQVFHKISSSLSPEAPLHMYGAQWRSAPDSDRMQFAFEGGEISLPRPNLAGLHQIWNAGAALAAFRIIAPDHFTPAILSTALTKIEWPGRLQTLKDHPFCKLIPRGWELLIDGGHNDSAGAALADQAAHWAKIDPKPLHLIVAMVNRKDPAAFLAPLLPYADSLTLTRIEDEPTSFAPGELYKVAKGLGFKNLAMADTVEAGLNALVEKNQEAVTSRILITGSLFLVGNVLGFKCR